MSIKFRTVKGKCSAKAKGMLTIYTALETMKQITKLLKKSKELVLDLSQVSEFDTAGLQLIILIKKETRKLNIAFEIKNPSKQVTSVFDKFCMTESLEQIYIPPQHQASSGGEMR